MKRRSGLPGARAGSGSAGRGRSQRSNRIDTRFESGLSQVQLRKETISNHPRPLTGTSSRRSRTSSRTRRRRRTPGAGCSSARPRERRSPRPASARQRARSRRSREPGRLAPDGADDGRDRRGARRHGADRSGQGCPEDPVAPFLPVLMAANSSEQPSRRARVAGRKAADEQVLDPGRSPRPQQPQPVQDDRSGGDAPHQRLPDCRCPTTTRASRPPRSSRWQES
jgi:hypothetical protein